ncbi:MAG TPA: AgmX/PglI C-terminal domain-containing protein [Polyangia bacterium]|nr:AgmX/PglI C-terminal domain-containing protein [Polyangia bacterium]
MNQLEALRVGVILDGKIVEERVVRGLARVTIGQSARATFAVPGSQSLPRSLVLFEPDGANYVVCVPEGCSGRVSEGEGARILSAAERVPLGARARGKLVIGDVTVLFQRLEVPAKAPRPRLPASVRSPFMKRVDWVLTAVLVVSLSVHFGCVGYLRSLEFPKPDLAAAPPIWIPAHFEIPKAKDKPKPAPVERVADSGVAPSHHAVKHEPARAPTKEELAEKVRKMGALVIVTARGEGEGGDALTDLLKKGNVFGKAGEPFEGMGGVDVASSGGTPGVVRGGEDPGKLRRGGDLKTPKGPLTVKIGDRKGEKEIEIKDSKPTDFGGGKVPPNVKLITDGIKQRLGGLRACYESGMRHSEKELGGKLQVRFALSSIGKVTAADAELDTLHDEDVTHCILDRVRAWRFPALGSEFEFSYPFIFTRVN